MLKTHHLTEMGKAEQLIRTQTICLGGSRVVITIDVKAAQLALVLHGFNPIGHQKVVIPKGLVEAAQFEEEIRIGEQDVVFQESDVIKRFPGSFGGMAGLKQNPLRFETEQAGVLRMADLLPIQTLTIAQAIENVAIPTNADTQINRTATVVNPIHTPLAVVQQSSRLAIEAMKLKDQSPQGLDPWPRVCGKRTMASIACLVVVNDGKQQTHRIGQAIAAN